MGTYGVSNLYGQIPREEIARPKKQTQFLNFAKYYKYPCIEIITIYTPTSRV